MSLAANALTTVAAVEAVVGDGIFADTRIEQLISAVSQDIETFCGRQFGKTVVTSDAPEYYAGNGRTLLALDRYPILAVSRVRIGGTAITDYDRAPHLDRQGLLYRGGLWTRSWPTGQDVTGDPVVSLTGYQIDVCYTAGYVLPQDATEESPRTLPYDLEQVCIDEVVRRLLRPAPGVTSERTVGGYSVTYAAGSGKLSAEAEGALLAYRARHIG